MKEGGGRRGEERRGEEKERKEEKEREEEGGEYDITTRVQECSFLVNGEDRWLVKRFHTGKQAITFLFHSSLLTLCT